MSHYYSNKQDSESKEKSIFFKLKEKEFHFITDNGVFSKSGLDFGSRILLESIIDIKCESLLDLGCGYGPLGIVYKYFNPSTRVWMTDINQRAVELAKKNAKSNKLAMNILISDGFSDISEEFQMIITNPPIRAGKKIIYNFFEEARSHLQENGSLIFVMNRKHGAESAMAFCEGIYRKINLINKQSGYFVVECIK